MKLPLGKLFKKELVIKSLSPTTIIELFFFSDNIARGKGPFISVLSRDNSLVNPFKLAQVLLVDLTSTVVLVRESVVVSCNDLAL